MGVDDFVACDRVPMNGIDLHFVACNFIAHDFIAINAIAVPNFVVSHGFLLLIIGVYGNVDDRLN